MFVEHHEPLSVDEAGVPVLAVRSGGLRAASTDSFILAVSVGSTTLVLDPFMCSRRNSFNIIKTSRSYSALMNRSRPRSFITARVRTVLAEVRRSEEQTSELQLRLHLACRF